MSEVQKLSGKPVSIVGMRNIIIHEYFGVDYETIWKTVKDRILQLYGTIKEILREYGVDY